MRCVLAAGEGIDEAHERVVGLVRVQRGASERAPTGGAWRVSRKELQRNWKGSARAAKAHARVLDALFVQFVLQCIGGHVLPCIGQDAPKTVRHPGKRVHVYRMAQVKHEG